MEHTLRYRVRMNTELVRILSQIKLTLPILFLEGLF